MSDIEKIDQLVVKYGELKTEIHKIIVGQDEVVDQVLISIFSSTGSKLSIPIRLVTPDCFFFAI